MGRNDAAVRVMLPDRAGRLRVVASSGEDSTVGRRRSARRRAFETGTAYRGDPSVTILPLVAEEQTLGVVEVDVPGDGLDGRHDAVLALVRQSATLLKLSQERVASDRGIAGLEHLFDLTRRLGAAPTAVSAMRAVAEVSARHLRGPVAVVRPDRSGRGWYLAAAAGVGSDARTRLRSLLQQLPRNLSDDAQLHNVRAAFEGITRRRADVCAAGSAFVVIDARHAPSPFVRQAVAQLEIALRGLAGHHGTEVDLGMAWTAHELRRPLVGASAALDLFLATGANGDRDLLRRTKAELDGLTDLVAPLLEWSVGRNVRKRDVDLVGIVDAAVAASCLDGERDRVVVDAPGQVPVRADVAQVRSAVANIVRNALTYSPSTMPVNVVVDSDRVRARVIVEDQGPGIPEEERWVIFDPFVRGQVGRDAARGNGLGLFIVRRVAEAHGGSIRVDGTPSGARFCLELPIRSEDPRVPAS